MFTEIALGSVGTGVMTLPFDKLFGHFQLNGNQMVARAALQQLDSLGA